MQGFGHRMLEDRSMAGQGGQQQERRAPLGAHVSTSGGVERAPERAREIGADAIQIFTSAPQRWTARTITDGTAEEFRRAVRRDGIRVTAAHDSYLINLASHRDDLFHRSALAFRGEVERATRLGLDFLVTHPGNATGGDRIAALARNAAAVAEVLESSPHGPVVLFETTAGTGTALGHRFEELADLLDAVPSGLSGRVGVCLDTAHVFAAGYDLRTDPARVLDRFDSVIGLERLRLFHLNDSAGPLGSRRDRHADIGEGEIGAEAFGRLLRDSRVRHVAGVLETPKGEDPTASDTRNLELLQRLIDGSDEA